MDNQPSATDGHLPRDMNRDHLAAPAEVVMIPMTTEAYAALDCFMADGHPVPPEDEPFDGRSYLFTYAEIAAMRDLVAAVRRARPEAGQIRVTYRASPT